MLALHDLLGGAGQTFPRTEAVDVIAHEGERRAGVGHGDGSRGGLGKQELAHGRAALGRETGRHVGEGARCDAQGAFGCLGAQVLRDEQGRAAHHDVDGEAGTGKHGGDDVALGDAP